MARKQIRDTIHPMHAGSYEQALENNENII